MIEAIIKTIVIINVVRDSIINLPQSILLLLFLYSRFKIVL